MESEHRESGYFQFPISALRLCRRAEDISRDDACLHVRRIMLLAAYRWAETAGVNDGDSVPHRAERWMAAHGGDSFEDLPERLAASFDLHRITAAELEEFSGIDELCQHLQTVDSAVGRDDDGKKQTRLRGDIVRDASVGNLSWRDFAVLAAVYACLNDRRTKAQWLTRRQLVALASGYGSWRRMPSTPLLKEHQLRWTLDKLEKRRFFVRYATPRRCWFSNSMTPEQLRRYVAKASPRKPSESPGNTSLEAGHVRLLADNAPILAEDGGAATSQKLAASVAASVAATGESSLEKQTGKTTGAHNVTSSSQDAESTFLFTT